MTTHNQCVLQRAGATQVSWIPSTRAHVGKAVDLKDDGAWSRGWRVMRVYDPALPSETVEARERDFTRHRSATDI
jgi:hypothetical protein